MKKYLLALAILATGCSIPKNPTDVDFTQVKTAFNPEIYAQGGRGYVVFSANNILLDGHDTVSIDDADGNRYQFRFGGKKKPVAAMLPAGGYKVANFESYSAVCGGRICTRQSMSDIVKNHDIGFSVKSGEFAYLGALNITGQYVSGEGGGLFSGSSTKTYNIGVAAADKSDKISAEDKEKYERESGRPFAVKIMNVKPKETK
ncbi:MAG: hypothetical protein LBT45_01035 [Rickettsiales bacterium]|jgi:hypothetical protein|nr:hypothetical protein [Rickettsiales bacterium]